MKQTFCQSCGMPLSDNVMGTDADGSRNEDYCIYCYKDGRFTQDMTMEQMIDFCAQFTDQMNETNGWNLTPEQAKEQMREFFPTSNAGSDDGQRNIVYPPAGLCRA